MTPFPIVGDLAYRRFSDVPQIISIVKVSSDGSVSLKKDVRDHLD